MTDIKSLTNNFLQGGTVEWIGVRPQRKSAVKSVHEINALEDTGLEGDHYSNRGGTRQVTLIQAEHLKAVASFLNKRIDPGFIRRNIVVKGINLLSLKDKQFTVGEAILEYTGECHPCSRMEENLGPGGYNAMRGHGGITARILQGGLIKTGDILKPVSSAVLDK